MANDLEEQLSTLVARLDEAIRQAIENPVNLAMEPALHLVEQSCRELNRLSAYRPAAFENETARIKFEKLIWQIRAQNGRLRMLIESGFTFYSRCFSLTTIERELEVTAPEFYTYGDQREWHRANNPSAHLRVDC